MIVTVAWIVPGWSPTTVGDGNELEVGVTSHPLKVHAYVAPTGNMPVAEKVTDAWCLPSGME